jgi:NADH-quinone oxidoreductase subunit G
MDDNIVTIEVDGVACEARKGQMLIEVTDAADIYVPRFCYHRKLSIAANCRMCLVDVEKAPKPLPACATPVMDGMKVFTRSPRAISAQKATMEFLLINHPLDCPICDQGGECELQDLAMGFGRGVSRYTERKRVVKDKNLGPLVSTDMTRCIHCTRCVRFGQEVAGIQELGTTGRSEFMEIGTFIEKSVDHELSGNIIDLCPVGALNNKPYRFSARAWEMLAKPIVSPHDCAGTNMYAHTLRGKLRRVVPRDNDEINESWIADRDRFSCYGVYAPDRLEKPMVKREQEWFEVSWQEALAEASNSLRNAVGVEGEALGVLASPNSTVEELYLLRRIATYFGSKNVDHRLRRSDCSDQSADPAWPWLGTPIAELDVHDGLLVVGSNLRMEVPIIAHRVRKAALAGAAVGFVNSIDYEYLFKKAAFVAAEPQRFVHGLASVLVAAAQILQQALPDGLIPDLDDLVPGDEHRAAARVVIEKQRALVLIGHIAQRHPQFSEIRVLAAALATLTGANLGYLAEGANGVGAEQLGFVPHRRPDGKSRNNPGFDVPSMMTSPRRAYVLLGVEPDLDFAPGVPAEQALKSADTVVCLTPFVTDALLESTDILLPVGTFAETPGTYVNAEGRWQSFDAAANTVGDSRPAWRVLRVLGNQLGVEAFEYQTPAEVRDAAHSEVGACPPDNAYRGNQSVDLAELDSIPDGLDIPIYQVDSIVRRSAPLQQTHDARAEPADLSEVKSA